MVNELWMRKMTQPTIKMKVSIYKVKEDIFHKIVINVKSFKRNTNHPYIIDEQEKGMMSWVIGVKLIMMPGLRKWKDLWLVLLFPNAPLVDYSAAAGRIWFLSVFFFSWKKVLRSQVRVKGEKNIRWCRHCPTVWLSQSHAGYAGNEGSSRFVTS